MTLVFRQQILLLLLFLTGITQAQPKLKFDHFTIANGLSNSGINVINQDSAGFLWIGTNDGLNRFDGQRFKVYVSNPTDTNTLQNSNIVSIYNKGYYLFVGSNGGLDLLNERTETIRHIHLEHSYDGFTCDNFYKDKNDNLLVTTNKGIYIFDWKGYVLKNVGKGHILSYFDNIPSKTIIQDKNGDYWVGTADMGVYHCTTKTGTVNELKFMEGNVNILRKNKIISLHQDIQGIVWIGSEKGLFATQPTSNVLKKYSVSWGNPKSIPHATVNNILEDSHKQLWFATNGSLTLYMRNEDSFVSYFHNDLDENSLSNNSVHCLFEDKQHNLWAGSGEDGLMVAKSQSINFFNLKRTGIQPLLNYSYVTAIAEGANNELWIGTNGGGVNHYIPKEKKVEYLPTDWFTIGGQQHTSIMSVMAARDGKIWIGAYLGGIVVYDPKSKQIFKYLDSNEIKSNKKSISNNIINHLYQDKAGNVWVATGGGGVDRIDHKTGQITNYSTNGKPNYALSSNFTTRIFEDSYGFIWIASYFGLNELNPRTGKISMFTPNNQPGSMWSNTIYDIYEDSKHQLWIGTEFGLHQYNRNKFTVYTTDNGLPGNVIKGILPDKKGNIWLSTNKGLCRFNLKSKECQNFGVQDGIISNEFYRGACSLDHNGWMYFGGEKGLTFFDPNRQPPARKNTSLIITGLYLYDKEVETNDATKILDKSITYTSKIKLRYDQSFISIEYARLNLTDPTRDSYSYILKGIDRQWNNVGNKRIAKYTNLPPGKYKFIVKSRSENGTENQASLDIVIRPPFWLSPISYIIYLLIIVTIIYFIYDHIHSRNRYKHNLLVERIEKEKAIEINQAKVRFFVNVSHEFKTPLTLIVSPLEKLISAGHNMDNEERNSLYHIIYRNTLRLSRLINQIMDLRKIDTGNIQLLATYNELTAFVKELALNFEDHARNHNIDFKVEVPEKQVYAWFDLDKIEKVVYNLLSNAFRYTPDGKQISIKLESKSIEELDEVNKAKYPEGLVRIIVADKGKGIPSDQIEKIFTRFYQINTETFADPACSGVGLSIAREFIDMHNGEITVTSQFKKGSEFTVILPLGKNHLKDEDIKETNDIDSEGDEILKPVPVIDNISDNKEDTTKDEQSQYKILVVEDNHELRHFLYNNLKNRYKVFEAANGKEALEIVGTNSPDIVVSDVMMPKMNGYELLKAIKTDVRTSHIPVILLTVLNSINNQLEGFEIGADDYITKPFNLPLLEARIFNLIESRKKLIRKFTADPKSSVEHFASNILDKKFMARAIEIVEKNLTNLDFTAEQFAEEINMSRSNLHVKLKALTGQSATEFIRSIKLKKSLNLLVDGRYNISEVSYQIGFNNVSYFNRCFKAIYGVTPGEYVQNYQEGKPIPLVRGKEKNDETKNT